MCFILSPGTSSACAIDTSSRCLGFSFNVFQCMRTPSLFMPHMLSMSCLAWPKQRRIHPCFCACFDTPNISSSCLMFLRMFSHTALILTPSSVCRYGFRSRAASPAGRFLAGKLPDRFFIRTVDLEPMAEVFGSVYSSTCVATISHHRIPMASLHEEALRRRLASTQ